MGDYFIFLATVCTVLSGVAYFLVWRGQEFRLGLARLLFRVSTGFVVAALAALMYLILVHDFAVAYVYSYSSSDLPLAYLISSLWGGQEGTFLLWILFAGIMGLFMMTSAKDFESGNMFFLNLFMLSILVILIKKSPFELMPVYVTEGGGLNPLLQNPWMTIHPPIMFVGFAGAVIPFCFALTALVTRKYDVWAEAARRWTILAWSGLGVSLVMGGYWAYETLGWGGFWAWDPVENASLIPWLFLTAQMHALFVKRHRRGLMRFSLIIVCLSFWSVWYGTFLTRSGVLADFSVHSFVDLGINQYLIGGLAVFIGIGAFLILLRWRDISPEPSFSTVNSRTYLTALGIVILFVGGLLVLLGTSAPLITRMSENPSSVGLSYYFITMTPVAVVLLILVALFPAFRWNEGLSQPRQLVIGGAALILTTVMLLIFDVTTNIMYLALFGVAVAAIVTNGWVFVRSLQVRRLRAGYLSHVGLALGLVGAAASAGFETKSRATLPQNEMVTVMGYDLTFVNIREYDPHGRVEGFDCDVRVSKGNESFLAVLPHEYSASQESWMKKPHVKSGLLSDIYFSPVELKWPEVTEPGTLSLEKGQTAVLDKYEITFHDFDMGSHDDHAAGVMTALAVLGIAYDDQLELVTPRISVAEGRMTHEAESFDNDRARVYINNIQPESGGVVLKVDGAFLPPADEAEASLVLELSKKPLIQLFWLGTVVVFISGFLSLSETRKSPRRSGASEEPAIVSAGAATEVTSGDPV
jgi:cytochrome c-type biogenesis protein CcmF